MGRYVQPIISDSLIVCPLGTIRGMRPAGEFHTVPEKPVLDGLEQAWSQVWDAEGVYRFPDPSGLTREQVYSIDTPPLTVSGSLHVGHCFSFTHTDIVARYQRMRGKAVFYPIGWDDNGLATERRVQNYFGVRCDPSLPYDPEFTPPADPPKQPVGVSRRNFVELCERLTVVDEQAFEQLWRHLGLSVDWSMTYQTVGERARAVSQRAFLSALGRGDAYLSEAPTLWDVSFRTAVAQAELEDREWPGAMHRVAFRRPDGEPLYIETTRPELIPACVALIAHPDDPRYAPLFGTTVRSPLFGVEVPVLAHPAADPEKGTGIAQCCTFGDLTDVIWWRELRLPTRPILGWDGRLLADPPAGIGSELGLANYAELAGKTVHSARERAAELLRESGDLDGEPSAVRRPVKFYEKGERPLEIVTTRQWYVRNGGRDEDLRSELLERGRELQWHPAHMRVRYENWVNGLNGDWLVSRQRFFGVPIPVWYRLDAAGEPITGEPILPGSLPVDPSSDTPPGFTADQRGVPGGFAGDPDIMDTWATSSLTPQIAGGWGFDEALFPLVFPMDLRPQAHEIIRTWLFSTVLRAHTEFGVLPWKHAAISGWILDPDRKKMSKSKGNVVTPIGLLEEFGADAVRYWAAGGRPGTDTAFDTGQMKVGRRLAIKLLNASRFVLGIGAIADAALADVTVPIDRALLARLADVTEGATADLDGYEYTRALERTEEFFWYVCDDYLELVKARAYGEQGEPGAASARAALSIALDSLLRLFAPFLPFVTEEVWSWWQHGSVHVAPWPAVAGLRERGGDPALLDTASAAIAAVRKAKSEARLSMRSDVSALLVQGDVAAIAALSAVLADVRAAGRVGEVEFVPSGAREPVFEVRF
ncbi:MAG: Valyl-tRNA synthetase [Actinomycetia bacterium]|nr:Valyl-tRNA synthetase [Actinomycetes bacterium]